MHNKFLTAACASGPYPGENQPSPKNGIGEIPSVGSFHPAGHEPVNGCSEPVPVGVFCEAIDIRSVFLAIVHETEAVRYRHMADMRRFRYLQFDLFCARFRGYPNLLAVP